MRKEPTDLHIVLSGVTVTLDAAVERPTSDEPPPTAVLDNRAPSSNIVAKRALEKPAMDGISNKRSRISKMSASSRTMNYSDDIMAISQVSHNVERFILRF